jgi:cobalt-zinc-cadmium efflux system protein
MAIGGDRRGDQRRILALVLSMNAALMAAEIAAGAMLRSLALLADAVHRLTDVSGLAIGLLALRLAERPATPRHSFGLQRAEVLAAQANAVILLGASGWVLYGAVRRLVHPVHVPGGGLMAVGSVGFVVSVASAWLLGRRRTDSLNMRAAFVHVVADTAGAAGAIVAGALILLAGLQRADPAASIVITGLVVFAAWTLARDTAHVLLEGTPRGMSATAVESALRAADGVRDVHHLHLWSLASDVPALSAHVVLSREETMHDAQLRGDSLKLMLAQRFGIEHATLELECHEHPHDPSLP